MKKPKKPVELVPEGICPITGWKINRMKPSDYESQKRYQKKNAEEIKLKREMKRFNDAKRSK
jgi:hypothetical protein